MNRKKWSALEWLAIAALIVGVVICGHAGFVQDDAYPSAGDGESSAMLGSGIHHALEMAPERAD